MHRASTPPSTPQVKQLVLVIKGEYNQNDIQGLLKLTDRKYFRESYLQPAINQGFIEMTQPDSPNSPTQKYRLTEKGKELQKLLKTEEENIDKDK